ncbi:MAG: Uncharacterised protein [Flavobacteriia bacterium]|nr:MAG: Uncharacterised protein [Flavobacteriia bacterium]
MLFNTAVVSNGQADLFDGNSWFAGKEQNIVSSQEGAQFDLPSFPLLICTGHVQCIGHHEALKAEFFL